MASTRAIKNVGDPDSVLEILTVKLEEVVRLNKDPELAEKLQGCLDMVVGLDDYLVETASEATSIQKKILADTYTEPWAEHHKAGKILWNLRPSMVTGYHEGQFLRIASQITKAKRILEIGTFTGHGAVSLAQSIYCEELICLEFDPFLVDFIKSRIAGTSLEKKVKMVIGAALDSLQKLKDEGRVFDLVFIDADKGNYINYYNFIMDNGLLDPSGTIMVDNTLWKGDVYTGPNSVNGKQLHNFNEHVRQDPRVNQVILPLHDGVTLIHRIEESD